MSATQPRQLLFLFIFCLLIFLVCLTSFSEARKHRRRHAEGGDTNRTRRRKFSSDIRIIQPNDNFTFYANESWLHVRTENSVLDHKTCLEYRISLEGKRTRWVVKF